MVRVIEYRSEAGPAPVLEIAVYRDLGGQPLATLNMNHRATGYNMLDELPDALPAKVAFLLAVGKAERERIPYVWVHDPQSVFPPEKRPLRQFAH
jgi:hypothetical protein